MINDMEQGWTNGGGGGKQADKFTVRDDTQCIST
jgi:hypothetical protein